MKLKSTKEDIIKGNIELFGNKQIIVDGCKGVIDYNEDFLKLDLGKIVLKVTGRNLIIDSYIYEQVDLKGEIVSDLDSPKMKLTDCFVKNLFKKDTIKVSCF